MRSPYKRISGNWKRLKIKKRISGTRKECKLWKKISGTWKRITPVPYWAPTAIADMQSLNAAGSVFPDIKYKNYVFWEMEIWFEFKTTSGDPGINISLFDEENNNIHMGIDSYSPEEGFTFSYDGDYFGTGVSLHSVGLHKVKITYEKEGLNFMVSISYFENGEWVVKASMPYLGIVFKTTDLSIVLRSQYLRYFKLTGEDQGSSGNYHTCIYDMFYDIDTPVLRDISGYASNINAYAANFDPEDPWGDPIPVTPANITYD